MLKKGLSVLVIALIVTLLGTSVFADTNASTKAEDITIKTEVEGNKVIVAITNASGKNLTNLVVTPNIPTGLKVDNEIVKLDNLAIGETKTASFLYTASVAGDANAGTVKATGKAAKTGDSSRNVVLLVSILAISGAIIMLATKKSKSKKTIISLLTIGILSATMVVGVQVASAATIEKTAEATAVFTVGDQKYDFNGTISYTLDETDAINSEPSSPNKYSIQPSILDFKSNEDLTIQTVGQWKEKNPNKGKTFFENGEALSDHDIIISNSKVGMVLAVGTRNPWGYPAGSILDAGYIKDNTPKRDTLWSMEFLVNGWDSWAPENCGNVNFDLVNYNFKEAKEEPNGTPAVRVSRKYTVLKDADKKPCDMDVVTYYGVDKDSDHLFMFDTVTNNGTVEVKGGTTRYAMTNKGDDGGALKYIKDSRAVMSYGDRAGQEYSTAFAVPEKQVDPKVNFLKDGGSLGYLELRHSCLYKPGETTTYQGYLIIDNKADTSLLTKTVNEINGAETINIDGTVTHKGSTTLAAGAVVVAKNADGKLAGFYKVGEDGKFAATLLKGAYTIFVAQDGYAQGEAVNADTTTTKDLTTGDKKDDLTINIKDQDGNPIWGKIDVVGEYPEVRYTGNSVYQSKEKGLIKAQVNDINKFTATVYGEGYFFFSNIKTITEADVVNGQVDVVINKQYSLPTGWLSGDMHHHGNKNDAFSDPEDVIPSMMISGLDVAMITDHDFTVNNKKAYDLVTGKYAGAMKGYIPSEEISCSWAHFNVLPQDSTSYEYFLDSDKENHVMNQFATFPEFLNQTINKGATLTANHPWYSYGLFYTALKGANGVPGGYDDNFANIEINACSSDSENADVIISAAKCWTAYQDGGNFFDKPVLKPHYLLGGSDTHDVLVPGVTNVGEFARGEAKHYNSGKARTIAYVDSGIFNVKQGGLAFSKAVAEGKSYVSFGPILKLDTVPASNNVAQNGKFTMNFSIDSLATIKDVIVLTKGGTDKYDGTLVGTYNEEKNIAYNKDILTETAGQYKVEMPVGENEKTWIAILVIDENGNYAITNPYWITGK